MNLISSFRFENRLIISSWQEKIKIILIMTRTTFADVELKCEFMLNKIIELNVIIGGEDKKEVPHISKNKKEKKNKNKVH